MKTISLAVLEEDYEAFKRAARRQQRPIAQLIREAMAVYRVERLDPQPRLETVPVLPGHEPLTPPPGREEIYDEILHVSEG